MSKAVHETLQVMLAKNVFEPFIRHIRFPHFRNLREGTRIEFGHPITVLTGPNGTNKTAILRAIQGCPDLYNVGQYWFSTSIDPIDPNERHRFIHGYIAPSVNKIVESMKQRVERRRRLRPGSEPTRDPDYFEPTRPTVRDEMEGPPAGDDGEELTPDRTQTRWKAIDKKVVYLDFRSELSAFDKAFFHGSYDKNLSSLRARKDLIRRRSLLLKEVLQGVRTESTWYRVQRIVKPIYEASPGELEAISQILGRKYVRARILTHRFFGVEAKSAILQSENLSYSEAFAGSGEFAVVVLVTEIWAASKRSLILLDEPEVSLHPGAQQKLMEFIADQSKRNLHQFVISSHSPEIVRDLPPIAIKVMHPSRKDGKVELVSQESSPTEAFFRLGVDLKKSLVIYVEDQLAVKLVQKAIRPLGASANSRLRIEAIPGGASSIATRFVPGFAISGTIGVLVFLDGDQVPDEQFNPTDVRDSDLRKVVEAYAHGDVRLSVDGHGGSPDVQMQTNQLRATLNWFCRNVDYLPDSNPEDFIIRVLGLADSSVVDSKLWWTERTAAKLDRKDWESEVTALEILAEQERAIATIPDDTGELKRIRDRVQRFLADNPT